MKITRRQLRKIITEAMYVPPGINLEPDIRKNLSPDETTAADKLFQTDPDTAAMLGGMPKDYTGPEVPERIIGTPDMPVSKKLIMKSVMEHVNSLNLQMLSKFAVEDPSFLYSTKHETVKYVMRKHYPGAMDLLNNPKSRRLGGVTRTPWSKIHDIYSNLFGVVSKVYDRLL